ncbi:MAG: hypothetical protein K9K66_15420 [Desulfarculaceae bacterium]|nr:hypothetical protein [Desulfarculaceae bacterium]MCF8073523.1 hypothetical protein [Desulfarculaceae bacterium]MCF8103045.1 hypothetical protein [Desulfarculaceae bacterium]MCF8115761.1 hypothetical protein [Desulfarculaceae bacterium]
MKKPSLVRLALILLAALALAGASLGAAQAFYKEIKLCPSDQNLWVNGLDPNKDTHTAATCVKGESKVNWSLDVIATQGGGLWGQGFECAGRDPWTYKNTYHHATNLQYFGQVGCVLIRITQD